MDIDKMLKLADELVFAKSGMHLDHLQEAILKGSLQDQTYSEIAEQLHLSKSHVRNTGSELWKTLSEELKKHITKEEYDYYRNLSKVYEYLKAEQFTEKLYD